jgi:hypothetical protein
MNKQATGEKQTEIASKLKGEFSINMESVGEEWLRALTFWRSGKSLFVKSWVRISMVGTSLNRRMDLCKRKLRIDVSSIPRIDLTFSHFGHPIMEKASV